MAVQVGMQSTDGCEVITLTGSADEGVLVRLADGIASIAEDGRQLVVDLDGLILNNVNAVHAFVARLLAGTTPRQVLVCCGRLNGRRILRRWGGDSLPLFSSTRDALAAVSFA